MAIGGAKWRYALPILSTVLATAGGHAAEMQDSEPSLIWSQSVAVRTPAPARIIIEGAESDRRFLPQAVTIPHDEPEGTGKAPLPVGRNLLDSLAARPFGSEERVVAVRSDRGLEIRCGEGTAPAGIVLETGYFYVPRAARLRLMAAGAGSGAPFGLSIVERGRDAPSPWQALIGVHGAALQLPPALAQNPAYRDIVINCPSAYGSFQLDSISLAPDFTATHGLRTGTWLWEAEAWLSRPGQIEDWAVASRLDRVFLQLRIDEGEVVGGTALADLIGRLNRRGVSVHAVEGDPAMVTTDGLRDALRRVVAIRRYQLSSKPDARLGGLQFDIEPYLLADFALDPGAAWSQWATAIQSLSSAWGEPVSIVVPFWMLDAEAGRAAIAAARHAISGLTVMAYRTQIDEVIALSEPWLAWGTLNEVPVRVAIENGPLGVELHRTFVRAQTGSVLLRTDGGRATVSLFSGPVKANKDGLAYAFHHETRVNPARISFMNNRGKLAVARSEFARLLIAWLSFDGLMIHGLDEMDRGVGGPRIPMPEARGNEAPDSDL